MMWRCKDKSLDEYTIVKFPIIPFKFNGYKYWFEFIEVTYKLNLIERLDFHGDYVTTKSYNVTKVKRIGVNEGL